MTFRTAGAEGVSSKLDSNRSLGQIPIGKGFSTLMSSARVVVGVTASATTNLRLKGLFRLLCRPRRRDRRE